LIPAANLVPMGSIEGGLTDGIMFEMAIVVVL